MYVCILEDGTGETRQNINGVGETRKVTILQDIIQYGPIQVKVRASIFEKKR